MQRSAFAWSDAPHYLGAVLDHLLGVKRAFSSCEALNDYFRIFIDEYTHDALIIVSHKNRRKHPHSKENRNILQVI
jgi:hypothetical protein